MEGQIAGKKKGRLVSLPLWNLVLLVAVGAGSPRSAFWAVRSPVAGAILLGRRAAKRLIGRIAGGRDVRAVNLGEIVRRQSEEMIAKIAHTGIT